MNKRGLRICCVCRKEYLFCPQCRLEDRNKPTWYFAYCSENCKNIYAATSDYENDKISADEAKTQLDKLDLSQIANFGESYQKVIMKINEETKPVEKIDKLLQTETVIFDDVQEQKQEKVSEKYYKKPRVKKFKDDGVIE